MVAMLCCGQLYIITDMHSQCVLNNCLIGTFDLLHVLVAHSPLETSKHGPAYRLTLMPTQLAEHLRSAQDL
jgi:hypothetical protein